MTNSLTGCGCNAYNNCGNPNHRGGWLLTPEGEAGLDVNVEERLAEAHAFRESLSDEDRVLFDIICDPSNDPSGYFDEDPAVEYAEFGGFYGYDAYSDAEVVASRLRGHYDRKAADEGYRDGAGTFSFEYGADTGSDYTVGTYTVSVYLGHEYGAYLSRTEDVKYLTDDRDATGLAAAMGYARNLSGMFERTLSQAKKSGLISPEGQSEA